MENIASSRDLFIDLKRQNTQRFRKYVRVTQLDFIFYSFNGENVYFVGNIPII